jgi:hypothetical protein
MSLEFAGSSPILLRLAVNLLPTENGGVFGRQKCKSVIDTSRSAALMSGSKVILCSEMYYLGTSAYCYTNECYEARCIRKRDDNHNVCDVYQRRKDLLVCMTRRSFLLALIPVTTSTFTVVFSSVAYYLRLTAESLGRRVVLILFSLILTPVAPAFTVNTTQQTVINGNSFDMTDALEE